MSWQCTSWALREAPAPTATARLVLIALADRCQPDGRSAWPTVDTLMAEAHTSESSVKRALKALEETGCIRRGNQKLAQWDEHGNYVPDPYRSVVWECCMNVTLEHVSEKPGRQARAERKERKTMRIIIDGNGRIDRQAMAVERLKTIDMTPAGGGDAQDWVGAWLDGFDQALDLCRALETALDADTGKELSGDAR